MTRIYHPYWKWEEVESGFYGPSPKGMNKKDGELAYKKFFETPGLFESVLSDLIINWKNSCEHNLTNEALNRVAWLGQAAVCYSLKVPADCRAGYNLIDKKTQEVCDSIATKYLNIWLKENEYE